ncbi:MAG TPA: non-reducing end alpha-L-arabinofuranosidase family hydrolase [Opitutaceae bacterium]|nr:non-reducing end alpha-L-arabinofuranosidase family hydrolase [Opitutaceae bacterium]
MKTMAFTRKLDGSIFACALAAAASAAGPSAAPVPSPFHEPLRWKSTGPLIRPISDESHHLVSIKDPTIVRYGGKWHIYATVANTSGQWSMVYLNFADWSEAGSAKQVYIDVANPGLRGYHCAPQLFYFRPQQKWYLLYQSQPATYSTTDDPSKPETWSAPKYFFAAEPKGAPKLWIDYWIICDDRNAYLFSSGDDGRWYRCQTKLEDFPNGFSAPVVVMETPGRFDLFEGSCVYRLKGRDQYLAFIECIGQKGNRYFKSFLADRLDGQWRPLHATEDDPFAGLNNMTYEAGVKPWTRDISHGELLRDGYDETLIIDPDHLSFLYQGLDQSTPTDTDYSQLPYQLALLRQDTAAK